MPKRTLSKSNKSNSNAKKTKTLKQDVSSDASISNKSPKNTKNKSKLQNESVQIKPLKGFIGKAPVDVECKTLINTGHVYFEEDNIYDAMLNQTNLQFNNNKYYIIQLLKENDNDLFYVWLRWGRVGKPGQNNLIPCGSDLKKAKETFESKFFDKTKNKWEDRNNFVKVSGKYDLLKMDYDKHIIEEECPKTKLEYVPPKSKLDTHLQYLIQLICDVKLMEDTVVEMHYDTKKAPLGKLTDEQVKAGYEALKRIETCITNNENGMQLVQACNDFYTRIPHDFGMKKPPLICTLREIKLKLDLLETLGDIQIALKIFREELEDDLHPIDRHYKALDCNLEALDPSDPQYQIVHQYLQNTHGSTHSGYTLDLLDVFKCEKKTDFKDVGNRMLLWHGSRLSNWAGILKQGLRIAPPEAPVTGYMFGKGIYFADMASKSANYCLTTRSKNEGLLVLSEVSLGEMNKLVSADYNAHCLPKGKHSVMGLGQIAPDPKMEVKLEDGTRVPLGTPINTNIKNKNGYTLVYNEYIVYDPKQVRLRYLVRVRFNYK